VCLPAGRRWAAQCWAIAGNAAVVPLQEAAAG
jgi:hypothetical protein